MRTLFFGFVAGLVLSLLRAPLGIDLFALPAVEAHTALGWRALALALVAVGFALRRSGRLPLRLLLALTAGYATHGLLLQNHFEPPGRTTLAFIALGGLVLLALGAGRGASDPAAEGERATALEVLGLLVAGAGLALGFETLARHLRWFGGTLAADDSLFGTVLLLLLAFGALALGWIVRFERWRKYAFPSVLAAASGALYAAMFVLPGLKGSRGFNDYLKHFGLDDSWQASWRSDALLAAALFVAPALFAGAALSAARGRARITALVLGAALGLLTLPWLLTGEAGASAVDKQIFSAQLLPIATLLGVGGAAMALLFATGKPALARWSAILLALACATPALLVEVAPQQVLSPWSREVPAPFAVFDTPEGLLTVEGPLRVGPSGLLKAVTLDRRRLAPDIDGGLADVRRLEVALELVPEAQRTGAKVLLVGQLTPARSEALRRGGAASVDRTGAWWRSMERLEHSVFEGSSSVPLAGERIAPDVARERVREGRYDLVVVPAVSGDAPRIPPSEAPEKTTVAIWLGLDEPLAQRDLGARVLFMAEALDQPSIALVEHARSFAADDPKRPLFLPAGQRGFFVTPRSWLATRKVERTEQARATFAQRLLRTAKGPQENSLQTALLRGLSEFYAAQSYSSPFDSRLEQVELPESALADFAVAARLAPHEPFVRTLWAWLARVLVEKRWVEEIYRHVQPLAEASAPWPELERALGRADAESLDFASAVKHLERAAAGLPTDAGILSELGDAQDARGDRPGAVESWRKAIGLRPQFRACRRKLALALVLLGNPEGQSMIEALLREDPADKELGRYLGPGPFPEPPRGFRPERMRSD